MKAGLTGLVAASVAALALASAAVGGGNGTSVTQFTATYPDGSAHCHGNRLVHDGRNAFIKDVETCVTTITFYAAGTYDVGDPSSPAYGWCSDFDGFATCNLATAGTLTVTYNRDGTVTWDIVAYYAQP
jgi:hypothetical protein